jgi:hypothetical protein
VDLTPEIAALGVDDDCGPCAEGGIERLAEARPDIDWAKAVHDVQGHDKDPKYWCTVCHPDA